VSEFVSISCDECRLQNTTACDDCVVTFLCPADEPRAVSTLVTFGRPAASADAEPPGSAVIVDAAEARAVRMLQNAGLVPRLRFERRVG